MPTTKQVNYALYLLGRAGYDTRYMNSTYHTLAPRMRERSGTVRGWLESLDPHRISELIDTLKAETEAKAD